MAPMPYDDVGDRTADLLALSDVKRWAVVKVGRSQSVAEHSFNVAIIAMELCDRLNVGDAVRVEALQWALVHDAPETLTGDISGRFKQLHPEADSVIKEAELEEFPWWNKIEKLVPHSVYWLVKLADRIESIVFIKTWGIGDRSEDVYRELLASMPGLVTVGSATLSVHRECLSDIVDQVINQSSSEMNGVQLRRFRTVKLPEGV